MDIHIIIAIYIISTCFIIGGVAGLTTLKPAGVTLRIKQKFSYFFWCAAAGALTVGMMLASIPISLYQQSV